MEFDKRKERTVIVRLSYDEFEQLQQIKNHFKTSISSVIRTSLSMTYNEYLNKHKST